MTLLTCFLISWNAVLQSTAQFTLLRFVNVDPTSFEQTMVAEGKNNKKINKCTKQLLGESIIQFLLELFIHAISHTRVSPSLQALLLPAGPISAAAASDAGWRPRLQRRPGHKLILTSMFYYLSAVASS